MKNASRHKISDATSDFAHFTSTVLSKNITQRQVQRFAPCPHLHQRWPLHASVISLGSFGARPDTRIQNHFCRLSYSLCCPRSPSRDVLPGWKMWKDPRVGRPYCVVIARIRHAISWWLLCDPPYVRTRIAVRLSHGCCLPEFRPHCARLVTWALTTRVRWNWHDLTSVRKRKMIARECDCRAALQSLTRLTMRRHRCDWRHHRRRSREERWSLAAWALLTLRRRCTSWSLIWKSAVRSGSRWWTSTLCPIAQPSWSLWSFDCSWTTRRRTLAGLLVTTTRHCGTAQSSFNRRVLQISLP